jgi:DnaJ-class molecular chaperone
MSDTKIRACRDCGGSGEQVNLSVPGAVEDCRQCRGAGARRVPVTRELVDA